MINVEVTEASQVGPLVHKYGVAIWRQAVPQTIIQSMMDSVVANLNNLNMYIAIKGGVMSSSVLPMDLREARATLEIKTGMGSILGSPAVINDDGLSSSGIYMTAKEFKNVHPWHQDASETFSAYGACVWVAMTDCGADAPGLSFVLRNPGKVLTEAEVDEYVKAGPILNPVYRPGDAVFFDCHSLHATYRTRQMTANRTAFKLTGTREGILRAAPTPSSNTLERRSVGSSDLSVSTLGLGCAGFGRTSAGGGGLDFISARAVVEAAWDMGVTLFDTADTFGQGDSEEFLGRILKDRRKDVVISTKWGGTPPSHADVKWGSSAHIRESLEASLRRLQTDYIDLYYAHSCPAHMPIAEVIGTMGALQREGKIRAFGLSNVSAPQLETTDVLARAQNVPRCAAVQNYYNLLGTEDERDVLPACTRLGVGYMAYTPLAYGILSGRYDRHRVTPDGTRIKGQPTMAVYNAIDVIENFARERGHTLLDAAFAGLTAHPQVSAVIAGATRVEQVRANAAAVAWKLTPEDAAILRKLTAGFVRRAVSA